MEKIDYALLILRCSFGISLAYHGYNKLSSGIYGTAGWFASIGMKWPKTQAWTAAITEICAGVLFAVGLFSGIATMTIIALMVVAIATVHWKVGYFIFLPNGGWEYCASIAVVSATVGIAGPGDLSFDLFFDLPISYGMYAAPFGVFVALCHLALSYRPSSLHQTS